MNKIEFSVEQNSATFSQSIETNKGFKFDKACKSFSHYMTQQIKRKEALKLAGFQTKGFSLYKPFDLTIKVNGIIVIDSAEAQINELNKIVLRGKHGAKIADLMTIIADFGTELSY